MPRGTETSLTPGQSQTTPRATLIGKIPEYSEGEDWEDFTERLESYFDINQIEGKGRADVLITVIDATTYLLLKDLVFPEKPSKKSYEELVEALTKHKGPIHNEMVERYTFHSAQRKQGEQVTEYLSRLRHLSEYCNFGDALSTQLRDRFVTGIQDENMLRKLLGETELTLEKSLHICRSIEQAVKNTSLLLSAKASPIVAEHDVLVNKLTTESKPQQRSVKKSYRPQVRNCHRCGEPHNPNTCVHKDSVCKFCKKVGHIENNCFIKMNSKTVHRQREDDASVNDEDDDEYNVMQLTTPKSLTSAIMVEVAINNVPLSIEVDTGASRTIVGKHFYEKHFKRKDLHPTNLKLSTYSGQRIPLQGTALVDVKYNGKSYEKLKLVVAANDNLPLLGRNWLQKIPLDWPTIFPVKTIKESNGDLEKLLQDNAVLFSEGLGKFNGGTVTIHLKENVKPVFLKARPVPYAIKPMVDTELDRLLAENVIYPIPHSEWATPVVPVMKPDKTVRLCSDFRPTVNSNTELDKYPIPDIKDLFAKLGTGKIFARLDLAHAYTQLTMDEISQTLCTINTHRGLFRYKRLPFGVSSSPAIFQRVLDSILAGIPGVSCYLDDVICSAETEQELMTTLTEVLKRLRSSGLKLKKSKCQFNLTEVDFLGHRINAEGLKPLPAKVAAIADAPTPSDVTQLRSWLGLFNYYSKFLAHTTDILAPLYELLQKGVKWEWTADKEAAFQTAKEQLTSDRLLVHYNPKLPLLLSCDASPFGVSAILSHCFPDGSERPVACASRTLNAAEKHYSHTEKEGLAVIFGVQKFHLYLYGRFFKVVTDHKPLLTLFSEAKPTTKLAASRLIRWSVQLSSYNYKMHYKPGSEHQNADALSRLPVGAAPREGKRLIPTDTIHMVDALNESALTFKHINKASRTDPIIGPIVQQLKTTGDLQSLNDKQKPYASKRFELSTHSDSLLWGARVVIPQVLRKRALDVLHNAHQGMAKMKALALSFIYWPKIYQDIEELARRCDACKENAHLPDAAPVHPWVFPTTPWSRIHIDHVGPFMGKTFLIVIDAYSKWIDAHIVPSTSSEATIRVLMNIFSYFGLPEQIVSDNASGFTSDEFKRFCDKNGIRHINTAPYHPRSNGQVERAVQIVKQALKKNKGPALHNCLSQVLFAYRTTPHSTTGMTPSELLMKRQLRTSLHLLMPDVEAHVRQQAKPSAEPRILPSDSQVHVKDVLHNTWMPATVLRQTGPLSYRLLTAEGRLIDRHIDHILLKNPAPSPAQDITTKEKTMTSPSQSRADSQESTTVDAKDTKDYPSRNRASPEYYGH